MSFCGSPAYLAPEMLGKTGSEKSADVYGIGALLYELLTGLPPYYSDDIRELFKNIKRAKLTFPKRVKPEAADLLRNLLNKDPKRRPLISEIKRHIFFRGVVWEDLESKLVRPPRLGSRWVQLQTYEDEEYSEIPSLKRKILYDEDYSEEDDLVSSVAEFNYIR